MLPIHIPALRERPEDIAPLVRHFAERCAARLRRPVTFDAGAVPLLGGYSWPGNVRELANIVERLAILATAELITAADIARVLPNNGIPAGASASDEPWRDIALSETLDQYERELIAKALSAARGNVAEAARRTAPICIAACDVWVSSLQCEPTYDHSDVSAGHASGHDDHHSCRKLQRVAGGPRAAAGRVRRSHPLLQ